MLVQKGTDTYCQKLVTKPYLPSISRPGTYSMKLELRTGPHICPIKHGGVVACNGASRPSGGLFCGSWVGGGETKRGGRGHLKRQRGLHLSEIGYKEGRGVVLAVQVESFRKQHEGDD